MEDGNTLITVALDTMGDFGPAPVAEGAWRAVASDPSLKVELVGPPELLEQTVAELASRPELASLDLEGTVRSRIAVVPATQVIGMGEHPVEAVRGKPDSSLMVAVGRVESGKADALVSPGNTGAVMAGATFRWGRFPGIERPALGVALPNRRGSRTLLVDAGANVDCRPLHLLQFAVMGYAYAVAVLGVPEPRVGLLNVGAEPGKGNEVSRKAWTLLSHAGVPFRGNVEGMDIWSGEVEVVVCDGFVGNVVLKSAEGLAETLSSLLQDLSRRPWPGTPGGRGDSEPGAMSALGQLVREAFRPFDWAEHGAAPLLGLNGIGFVAHGRSNARAIQQALHQAVRAVRGRVLDHLAAVLPRAISANHEGVQNQ